MIYSKNLTWQQVKVFNVKVGLIYVLPYHMYIKINDDWVLIYPYQTDQIIGDVIYGKFNIQDHDNLFVDMELTIYGGFSIA